MAEFGERAFGRRTAVTGAGVLGALAVLVPRSSLAAEPEGLGAAEGASDRADSNDPHQRPASSAPGREPQPAGDDILRLFGEIRPGAQLARWSVVSIYGIHLGAIAVVLEGSDRARFQLDVLRHDPAEGAPNGIGSSSSLTVFLANAGNGATRTLEDHGIAALALAQVLSRNEGSHPLPAALCTMRQRLQSTPTGSFSVLG